MSLTNFAENAILNHILGNTAYTPLPNTYLYVALGNTPTEGGTWTEATYGAYQRQVISFSASSSRSVTQNGLITFPKSTSGDETYNDYAIFDHVSSSTNMLAYGSLNNAINVVVNSTPSIGDGEIIISVTAGSNTGLADYAANKTLDFMFNGSAFPQPTIYIALATAVIGDTTTGTTLADPNGNNYARKVFSDWSTSSAGTLQNNTSVDFAIPSGTWGTISSAAVLDALTDGNLLFYDNSNIVDQIVGLNDDVKFLAGDFDITLN